MAAINQDVTHWAGDSAIINILVADEDGNKVELSGCTARWWMSKAATSTGTDVLVKKATGGEGVEIQLGTDFDSVSVALDPTDTEGRKAGSYYHECEIVKPNGDIATVMTGKFIIKPTVIPNPTTED